MNNRQSFILLNDEFPEAHTYRRPLYNGRAYYKHIGNKLIMSNNTILILCEGLDVLKRGQNNNSTP